jgi:hypothetical protein
MGHTRTLLHVLHHFLKAHPEATPIIHPWSDRIRTASLERTQMSEIKPKRDNGRAGEILRTRPRPEIRQSLTATNCNTPLMSLRNRGQRSGDCSNCTNEALHFPATCRPRLYSPSGAQRLGTRPP